MSRWLGVFGLWWVLAQGVCLEGKVPEIDAPGVTKKLHEIMQSHATYKSLTPELAPRVLHLYLEETDPLKSYLIVSDVEPWLNPTPQLVQKIVEDYNHNSFATFEAIDGVMRQAIERRRQLEVEIQKEPLPKNVRPEEFKDMQWVKNIEELQKRILRIRALQAETASKFNRELQMQSLQRIAKRQTKFEDDYLNADPVFRERHTYSNVLKAVTGALDTHTVYFTPDEASQFLINVQQRLFGIGAQLRDDLSGFSIVKIIEGGPAATGKQLRVKDRIIAVDGTSVVGMDIAEAVELIRGPQDTPVVLTIVRMEGEGEAKKEQTLAITVMRGEVVLKETRYDVSFEPYADGGIAYLGLHSFYQDPEYSSAGDLTRELELMKKEHRLYGVILDMRYNSGGMLAQAVKVAGLFINNGVVVSIKDENGQVQHMRHIEGGPVWEGPLILLINRASASASEIVAQTLQDYGRGLVVGDDHSYGKGSYQTFTLNANGYGGVNPQGEYKVTRGRYYTVSGGTPQLEGVKSDIEVPGPLSEQEIGEKYAKYPLISDRIAPSFEDDFSDVSFAQRSRLRLLYAFNMQNKVTWDSSLLTRLRENSSYRVAHNKPYQSFLKELKNKDRAEIDEEITPEMAQQPDYQLNETFNIMRDLIALKGLLYQVKTMGARARS